MEHKQFLISKKKHFMFCFLTLIYQLFLLQTMQITTLINKSMNRKHYCLYSKQYVFYAELCFFWCYQNIDESLFFLLFEKKVYKSTKGCCKQLVFHRLLNN